MPKITLTLDAELLEWLVTLVGTARQPEQLAADAEEDPDAYLTMMTACMEVTHRIRVAMQQADEEERTPPEPINWQDVPF